MSFSSFSICLEIENEKKTKIMIVDGRDQCSMIVGV
jgi:hypothetical protein